MIPTRRFGRTELPMPVLSCGGMRFQHRWDEEPPKPIPRENQENLEKTIHRALALGLNHLETARGYGTSEAQLAPVLQTIPRDRFILQTKVSPQADPDSFEKIFRTSLSRLAQPFVDLFSLHGINQREILHWSMRPGGCLHRARQLQKQGLCRWVGFSTHGSPDLVEELCQGGLFDYVNLHWYYIFQEHTPSLHAAQKNDMGVFIISPNDKGGMLYQPPAKLSQATSPLSPMTFNTLFCLQNPHIHTLSVGAARPTDFDAHVAALALLPQTDTLLPPIAMRLQALWTETHSAAWRQDWAEGLPPWVDCPREANFREILRLDNLAQAYDLVTYAQMRYNLLGQGGHWFPGRPLGNLTAQEIRPALIRCPQPEVTLAHLLAARDRLQGQPVERLSQST